MNFFKALFSRKTWKCYFCARNFTSRQPKVIAYIDETPVYQCSKCKIEHDAMPNPPPPEDSQG